MRLAAHNIVIATALAARAKRRRLDMSNTHRITTTAAVLLSLATAGAPAASARPADYVPAGHQAPAGIYSRPDKSTIPASPPATSGGAIGRPALLPVLGAAGASARRGPFRLQGGRTRGDVRWRRCSCE